MVSRLKDSSWLYLYEFFDRLVGEAYRHPWLAANPVLARSLYTGFVQRLTAGDAGRPVGVKRLLKSLGRYYLNCFHEAARFLKRRRTHRASGQRYEPGRGDVLLVDSVYYVNRVGGSDRLGLINFPGLEDDMKAAGQAYVVAAVDHGGDQGQLRKFFDEMMVNEVPGITLYQALGLRDIAHLFFFIALYPFALLRFLMRIRRRGELEALVVCECVETLSGDVVYAFLRYLYGAALGRMLKGAVRVVGWFENRASDKLFYKGLRDSGADVNILGAQPFIFPDKYLGCYVNSSELGLGFGPDRIMANGEYYLQDHTGLEVFVGPPLRYEYVFDFEPTGEGGNALVLLSYNLEASKMLLSRLAGLDGESMIVHLHPSMNVDEIKNFLPPRSRVSRDRLQDVFREADVVIGVETGAMVEAVACGLPVVQADVLGESGLRYLPALGENSIWFNAAGPDGLRSALERARKVPLDVRREFASAYRTHFFGRRNSAGVLAALGFRK